MHLTFTAVREDQPGEKWRSLFRALWPAYQKWFISQGDAARPSYLVCMRQLRAHMPELVSTYEKLIELAGGGDAAARFLSLYRPTPYLTGCSQAVWTRDEPTLVRNYDYRPDLCEAVLLCSTWNGQCTIAMSDCLWGVLDGINENGLAVSLSFGGRKVVGDGFGIPLILRYILEFCSSVREGIKVLTRVPSHMAYNVTLLDRHGDYRTIFVAPDEPPVTLVRPFATNHQRRIDWHAYAQVSGTVERERFLAARIEDERETPQRFTERFLEPPLYTPPQRTQWGTLYTAVYYPSRGTMELRWPGSRWLQSFGRFTEGEVLVAFRNTPDR